MVIPALLLNQIKKFLRQLGREKPRISVPRGIDWEWKQFADFTEPSVLYQILALRSQVFVVEQACAYLDLDGKDDKAYHLLGWDVEQKQIIAYARVFFPTNVDPEVMPSIGRVVVAIDYRGKGLATILMQKAIEYIRNTTFKNHTIVIFAQYHLIAFYQKLGFQSIGQPYDEDGILHIKMLLPFP